MTDSSFVVLTRGPSEAARETGHSNSRELTLAGCHGEAVLDTVGVGEPWPKDVVGFAFMIESYKEAIRQQSGIH